MIVTESGRTLTGIVIEKDARVVCCGPRRASESCCRKTTSRSMNVTGISLMPEGLLQGLSDQEVCDLFAYLRSGQPLNEPKK